MSPSIESKVTVKSQSLEPADAPTVTPPANTVMSSKADSIAAPCVAQSFALPVVIDPEVSPAYVTVKEVSSETELSPPMEVVSTVRVEMSCCSRTMPSQDAGYVIEDVSSPSNLSLNAAAALTAPPPFVTVRVCVSTTVPGRVVATAIFSRLRHR